MTKTVQNESEEVLVNYFVLCDHVITEAVTNKQSLVGIYSALMADQFPLHADVAVALGIRVQSSRPRELRFHFSAPDGELLFPPLPLSCNWSSVDSALQASGFATLQISLNLRSIPFGRAGVYNAALFCDSALITTYPLSVLPAGT